MPSRLLAGSLSLLVLIPTSGASGSEKGLEPLGGWLTPMLAVDLDQDRDDEVRGVHHQEDPHGAPFVVLNWRTFEAAWEGVVEMGSMSGGIDGALQLDVDGDGSSEALLTASGFDPQGVGRHSFVAAFEAGGEPRWNLEL